MTTERRPTSFQEAQHNPKSLISAWDDKNIASNNNGIITFPVLPHQHVLERRLRERGLDENDEQVTDLYQGYGTHYVDLWIGSPEPQRQTVIVDTGSKLTAFPCTNCSSLGTECNVYHHFDSNFNESRSQTFQSVSCHKCSLGFCSKLRKDTQCLIRASYTEGSSWVAYEAIDRTFLGQISPSLPPTTSFEINNEEATKTNSNLTKESKKYKNVTFDLRFACQTKLSGFFKTQLADGIMGLNIERDSFWYQLHREGVIFRKQFTICLAPKDKFDPLVEKSSIHEKNETHDARITAGFMTFGGAEEGPISSRIVYAQLYSSIFYTVKINKIYILKDVSGQDSQESLNGKLVPVKINVGSLTNSNKEAGYAIVDSGATETYLNNIKEEFQKKWKEITGFDYEHEYTHLTEDQLSKIPTIIIQLKGDVYNENAYTSHHKAFGLAGAIDRVNPFDIIIKIPPSHYVEYSKKLQKFVTRIVLTSSTTGNDNILGSNTLQGHIVLFDIEKSKIGFSESSCNYAEVRNGSSLPTKFEFETMNSPPGRTFNTGLIDEFCSKSRCQKVLIGGTIFFLFCVLSALVGTRYLIARSRDKNKNNSKEIEFKMINNSTPVGTFSRGFS